MVTATILLSRRKVRRNNGSHQMPPCCFPHLLLGIPVILTPKGLPRSVSGDAHASKLLKPGQHITGRVGTDSWEISTLLLAALLILDKSFIYTYFTFSATSMLIYAPSVSHMNELRVIGLHICGAFLDSVGGKNK